MTTAQKVFDIAMGLMDELSLGAGLTDHADTQDYRLRTPLILAALCGELYPFSDTWHKDEPGVRPVWTSVSAFDEDLGLDDFIARSVLPYGLAAHLLADENPSLAAFFLQRYQELLIRYGGAIPAESERIVNLYGRI